MKPRAREILQLMADAEPGSEDAELVVDGTIAYVGLERTNKFIVHHLLRRLVLTDVSDVKGIERYVISDTGRAVLRRPELEGEILAALAARERFTIRDDHLVPI